MITIYKKENGQIVSQVLDIGETIPRNILWIDLVSPTREQELYVEQQLGLEIPSREEVWKNQVLNRLYEEDGVAYMNAAIITKVDSPYPQTSAVTFILTSRYLLTLRYIVPTSFQLFAQRLQRNPIKFCKGSQVLEGLMEEIITRVAHNSEVVVDTLDQLSHSIFEGMQGGSNGQKRNPSQVMQDVLKRLSTMADLNSKINESLHSVNRMLSFFRQHNKDPEMDKYISTLVTDVMALDHQTEFLSNKITFQLDATLGMINVEQNVVIKIFSVVAVFFLPPTLVSSMYGMNFADMPELKWQYGYPMAVALMMLCAAIPYIYFRKKGWL